MRFFLHFNETKNEEISYLNYSDSHILRTYYSKDTRIQDVKTALSIEIKQKKDS